MKSDKRNCMLQWINAKTAKELKIIVCELVERGVETEELWIRCPDDETERAVVCWESNGVEVGKHE